MTLEGEFHQAQDEKIIGKKFVTLNSSGLEVKNEIGRLAENESSLKHGCSMGKSHMELLR